ncbi:nucleoplasmin-like [Mantella aurantiaca]
MTTMSSDKYQSFSLSSIRSETTRQVCEIWGGELSASCRACSFEFKEDFMLHSLSLWTICLGCTAKDEMHVIAVETEQTQGQPVVIGSLRPSLQPMVNVYGTEFMPPVAFTLLSGSGPVYISGQHMILNDSLEQEEENLSF